METYSRYDFMKEGTVMDDVSNSMFPDPLSLNYLNYFLNVDSFETGSRSVKLTEDSIKYFTTLVNNIYGAPIYDDIILTLNNIPHKNFLKPGDVIIFPDINLIKTSFGGNRLNE